MLHVAAPARTGGLESVVVQLTSGLRQRGHEVQVATVLSPGTEHDHPVLKALEEHGVPVHLIVLGVRDYLAERRAIRRVMECTDADILHTHGYRPDVVLGDVARRSGRPHVMTLHGFVGGSPRGRLYEWMQVQVARHASAVVAVSTTIEQRLHARGIAENVHLIRNAFSVVDDPLSREHARALLGLPPDGQVVGWVGRVSEEKGPDLFIQSLARTSGSTRGILLGDGPLLAQMRRLAQELGIGERISLTGNVPNASRYLAAMDVLALTSRTEGTPMILLEAMSMGVPIIATAVGGVPDVLGDGAGVLASPGDAAGIATAMERLCSSDAERSALIANARAKLNGTFSFSRWLEAHEAMYRNLLRTGG